MTAIQRLLNLCVPTLNVADVSFNSTQILRILADAASSSTSQQLCLFPQLALSGSTCGDLFFQPLLAEACLSALDEIETALLGSRLSVVMGMPLLLGGRLYDAAAVITPQGLLGFALNKNPDSRYFSIPQAESPTSLSWKGRHAEIFQDGQTLLEHEQVQIFVGSLPKGKVLSESSLVLNPTALPALADDSCDYYFKTFSAQIHGVLAICSAGAAESTGEAVFSGLCQVWRDGGLLSFDRELTFQNKVLQVDTGLQPFESLHVRSTARDRRLPFLLDENQDEQLERAFEVQAMGLAGRLRHTRSEKLLLGISGGADSSMALMVCCHALDLAGIPRENMIVVSMPGPGSSDKSRKNSDDLTNLAEIEPLVIPIKDAVQAHLISIGHNGETADITFENAYARERTQILMNLANLHSGLVVGTGDLSEIALGWSTYNGDQMSMYNVNAGLPKTVLLRLLVWAGEMLFGKAGKSVAQNIANTPISAELKPLGPDGNISQATEDVLGPYLLHEFFLWHAIHENQNPATVFDLASEVFAEEYEPRFILQTLQTFYQRFFRNQFKRTAAPDGPRLFSLSLSARDGWRMPADASAALWLEQLDHIDKRLQTESDQ